MSIRSEGAVKEKFKTIQKRAALLLNSSYEALKVISWQRALILWLSEKVEVLEFHDSYISSSRAQFPIPSIIRLKSYISSAAHRRIRFSKHNVYLRDLGTCQYCGKRCTNKEFTIDHVIPVSKQGPENWSNVVAACRHCNQKKGNRTPAAAGMPLLREPGPPRWMTPLELELRNAKIPTTWRAYLKLKTG
jgi:5-methylcytosine-specific restriction endonuclease McrA